MHDLAKTEIVIANYLHNYLLILEPLKPVRDEQGNCSVCATGTECGICQTIQDVNYLASMLKSGIFVISVSESKRLYLGENRG